MFKLENYFPYLSEAGEDENTGGGDTPPTDNNPPAGSDDNTPPTGNEDTPPEGEDETPPKGNEETPPSDRPDWLPEGFDTPEELAEAHQKLIDQQGGFTGAPEGEYEINLAEGLEDFQFYEHEKGDIKTFMDAAKEMNMSQESFDRLMGIYVDSKIISDEKALLERQEATLKLVGGENELATINAKAKAQLTAEQFGLLQHAASTAPDAGGAAILLVNSLALGGETKPITQFTPPAPMKTKGELREMMKDPRYKSDPEYRAEILKGFEALENAKE